MGDTLRSRIERSDRAHECVYEPGVHRFRCRCGEWPSTIDAVYAHRAAKVEVVVRDWLDTTRDQRVLDGRSAINEGAFLAADDETMVESEPDVTLAMTLADAMRVCAASDAVLLAALLPKTPTP